MRVLIYSASTGQHLIRFQRSLQLIIRQPLKGCLLLILRDRRTNFCEAAYVCMHHCVRQKRCCSHKLAPFTFECSLVYILEQSITPMYRSNAYAHTHAHTHTNIYTYTHTRARTPAPHSHTHHYHHHHRHRYFTIKMRSAAFVQTLHLFLLLTA